MAQDRITYQEQDGVIAADADDVSALVDDNANIENTINAELGLEIEHTSIRVHEIPENGKQEVYLFTIRGEKADGLMDRVLEQYGSGTYHAWVYVNGKLRRHKTFVLKAPKKAAAPVADQNSTALTSMVNQHGVILATLVEKLTQMQTPSPPPPPANSMGDAMALVKQLTGIMKDMIPPAPPPPPAVNSFDMFASAIELVKGIHNEGKEKGMFDLISDFAPVIQQAIGQQQAISATPTAPRALPSQPVPAQRPPQAPSDQAAHLANVLNNLVARANAGGNPEVWADVLLETEDPQLLSALVQTPNVLEQLGALNPGVLTHRAWFADVIAALKDSAIEPNADGLTVPPSDPTQARGQDNVAGATPVVSQPHSSAVNADGAP